MHYEALYKLEKRQQTTGTSTISGKSDESFINIGKTYGNNHIYLI
jgi:hypothetical protein